MSYNAYFQHLKPFKLELGLIICSCATYSIMEFITQMAINHKTLTTCS